MSPGRTTRAHRASTWLAVAALCTSVSFGFGPSAAAAAIDPAGQECFTVTGNPGDAAIVNLTPVNATTPGNGQLISSNNKTNPPTASNTNYAPGTTDPNVAITTIGTDNQVCFQNSNHATVDLIADHLGTITNTAYTPATTNGAPQRVVDTRTGQAGTTLTPGAQLCFTVTGNPGDAAIVNLTPVNATTPGNGQLISSNNKTNPPTASNTNYAPGTTDPNVAITTIGTDNQVCFQNSNHATVDLIADHLGTITNTAYTPATTNGAPQRVVDTRTGQAGTTLTPGAQLCFTVTGNPGDAAIVNLTPVNATTPGNGQLISSNNKTNPPTASNTNYAPGTTDPNVAITTIGTDNQVCFQNSNHATVDLIADHLGTITNTAYTPATTAGAPDRRIDTRVERSVRPDCDMPDSSSYSTAISRVMYGLSSRAYEVEPGIALPGAMLDDIGSAPVTFRSQMACWELVAAVRGGHTTLGPITDTEVIIARNIDTDDLVVSFRGTDGFLDVVTDVSSGRTSWTLPNGQRMDDAAHVGFRGAYDAVRAQIISVLEREQRSNTPDSRVFFTGHSLGGALATVASLDLFPTVTQLGYDAREIVTYTYAAPRSLSKAMVDQHAAYLPNSFAVVSPNDPVPHLPTAIGSTNPYAHLQQMFVLNADDGDSRIRLGSGDGRDYGGCSILVPAVGDHLRPEYDRRMSSTQFLGAPVVSAVPYNDPIPFAIDNIRMLWSSPIEGPCDQVALWNRSSRPTSISGALRDRWAVLDTNDQHSTTVNVGDANWIGYIDIFGQVIAASKF